MEQKLKTDARLSESELLDFHFTLKRLKKHEPIQYILGEAPFMGLTLNVSPATLIPRPETEELVALLVSELKGNPTVLDIGTGSGCIPIAIKHLRPHAHVFALDVSSEAIDIATKNAKQNQTEVTFGIQDILAKGPLPTSFPTTFDFIVSNPPYVRNTEKETMEKHVLDHEPHLALFVEDDDPLIFYKVIAEKAKLLLSENGKLYFEINQYLADDVSTLLTEMGYKNTCIHNDINDNPRMAYAEK
jgi:release factor glutamine methyltransferase